jgi:hypothetical protein
VASPISLPRGGYYPEGQEANITPMATVRLGKFRDRDDRASNSRLKAESLLRRGRHRGKEMQRTPKKENQTISMCFTEG